MANAGIRIPLFQPAQNVIDIQRDQIALYKNTTLQAINQATAHITNSINIRSLYHGKIRPQPTRKAWHIVLTFVEKPILKHWQASLRQLWKQTVFLVKPRKRRLYRLDELIKYEEENVGGAGGIGTVMPLVQANRDAARAYICYIATRGALAMVEGNATYSQFAFDNYYDGSIFRNVLGYKRKGRGKKHGKRHHRRHGHRRHSKRRHGGRKSHHGHRGHKFSRNRPKSVRLKRRHRRHR